MSHPHLAAGGLEKDNLEGLAQPIRPELHGRLPPKHKSDEQGRLPPKRKSDELTYLVHFYCYCAAAFYLLLFLTVDHELS